MAPHGHALEVSTHVHECLAENSLWPAAVLTGASEAITRISSVTQRQQGEFQTRQACLRIKMSMDTDSPGKNLGHFLVAQRVYLFISLFFFWLNWIFLVACGLSLITAHWISCPTANGILVPRAGIKPMFPSL